MRYLVLLLLTGCTSATLTPADWLGVSTKDLVTQLGQPDESYSGEGGNIYVYHFERRGYNEPDPMFTCLVYFYEHQGAVKGWEWEPSDGVCQRLFKP